MEVMEGTTVCLECEMSKPGIKTKWFRDRKEIDSAGRFNVAVDGNKQTLVISDVTLDDRAVYKCTAGDNTTKANLLVEGETTPTILYTTNLQ